MHIREGNSARLFEVENADCPPSLSKHGVLRSGQKSDLLSCLKVDFPSHFDEADAKLIDGAHMVHFVEARCEHQECDTIKIITRDRWSTLQK